MSDTSTDLRRTFDRIMSEHKGEARSAALERHLEAAEASGDAPLRNRILAALIDSYEYSQDDTRLIVPFARLLREFDTAPEHFDASLTHRVYWMFKWVVGKLIEHPDVPLVAIEDWLARMRARYAEAGHSLHPVYEAEHRLAEHLGDADRAARAAAAITEAEPDGMSDCRACRCNYLGGIAAAAGEDRRALDLWRPVLEGGLRCAHEPHAALASSLLPLVRLGRLDSARANHLRGYQLSRGKDDLVYAIAGHVRFCALTGNEARAVEILASHARCLDLRLDPRSHLLLLEAVQVTCASLVLRGSGDAAVPGPGHDPRPAAEVHDRVDTERRALCERYDRRNGNDAQSRASAERARPAALPHVPLGLRADPPASPRPEPPRTFEAALEAARAASAVLAEDSHDLWAAVGRLADGRALDPADQAEVLLARIEPDGDLGAALALAEQAREQYAAAGLHGKALANRASTLLWRAGREPREAVAEEIDRIDADARNLADREPVHALRARALAHLALVEHLRSREESPDPELRARIDRIDAELASHPDEPRATQVRARLGMSLAAFETEPDARLAGFRCAFDHAVAGDHSYETFACATEYASMLGATGRFEEALRVAETGMACVKPEYPAYAVAALHLMAAECALSLDRPETAESYAVRAASHFDGIGETAGAGLARHLLGAALAAQDRHGASVIVLEAALADLAVLPEAERWRLVDSRFRMSAAHERLDEPGPGCEQALEALRLMDAGHRHPDPTVRPRAAHLAAVMLERLGESAAAAAAYRRAAEAWRELRALPAAAGPSRAAVWADLDTAAPDRAGGLAALGDLAAELRTDWRDEELAFGYRESCRAELGETLAQFAEYRDDGESIALLREAVAVFASGEYIVDRAVRAAHRLMDRLADLGDLAAAEAAAKDAVGFLEEDDRRRHYEGFIAHLRELRDASGQ